MERRGGAGPPERPLIIGVLENHRRYILNLDTLQLHWTPGPNESSEYKVIFTDSDLVPEDQDAGDAADFYVKGTVVNSYLHAGRFYDSCTIKILVDDESRDRLESLINESPLELGRSIRNGADRNEFSFSDTSRRNNQHEDFAGCFNGPVMACTGEYATYDPSRMKFGDLVFVEANIGAYDYTKHDGERNSGYRFLPKHVIWAEDRGGASVLSGGQRNHKFFDSPRKNTGDPFMNEPVSPSKRRRTS